MAQFKSLDKSHVNTSKIKYVFIDYSEEDNCIEQIKKANLEVNKPIDNLYTGIEFIEKTGYDVKTLVLNCLEIFNNVYNIGMTNTEINDIIQEFIEYMINIRNEVITKDELATKAGIYFSDLYTNKFTNYMKENDKKLLVKFRFDTNKTFIAFNECLFKIKDFNTNILLPTETNEYYIFCIRI